MPRPPPRPLRNLLFGLAVSACLLYLAEVGLRLGGVSPAYQADLVGGWRMLPEMHGETMHGTREASAFVVTTNADGLRTNVRRARTPGVPRVMLLGDSTVFGWGVDDGGTIADGLADGLRALGREVEVLNAGQPGYTTTQMEQLFTNVGAAYSPDLLVVFIPMHDDNRVLISDREALEGPRGVAASVRVALARYSRLYQLLRQSLFPLTGEAYLVPGRDDSSEPRVPRVSAAERDDNLDRMRGLLAPQGGRLVVGHLPFLGDLEGAAPERFSVPWAEAYRARTGVDVLDLRACCVGRGGAALTQPNDPGHLVAEGNRLVGGAAAAPVAALLDAGAGR